MTPRLTAAAQRLIVDQRGLIADWQTEAVGLNRRRLMRACHCGWRQVTPHVFARDAWDLTPSQARQAGLLEAGPGAALAGRSALFEAGWKGTDEGYVDVALDRGVRWRSRSPVPWLRLHFPVAPPRLTGHPSRTIPPRSAIDAAAWARTAREALVILVSTAQQRLVTPEQLRRELESRGRIPNRRRIAGALTELEGGATSSHEAAFLRECRRRGLPTPRMQTRRRARGRNRITDAEFVLPDGRLLIVEIDGIGHLEVSAWHADMSRQNDLALSTGALILRVTGWEVHHDPDPFFDMVVDLMNPFR